MMQTFLFNETDWFRKEDVWILLGSMKIFNTAFFAKNQRLFQENE